MKIKIKYFGMLTDITSCEEEIIDFSGVLILELLEVLFIKYPNLKDKKFQVAQNNELVPVNIKISSQEIVLLPPFSGG
jgi:molybdopterin synthase sulfur carrier subunit